MRSAPFGLDPLIDAADLAVECVALTHGHPTGQIASGAFATIIAALTNGASLSDAADSALRWARAQPGGDETVAALEQAITASEESDPSAEQVAALGQCWVAEEALAIALYCSLAYPQPGDFLDALSLAVTHSGDSDSTGAICGNILGTLHGEHVIHIRQEMLMWAAI